MLDLGELTRTEQLALAPSLRDAAHAPASDHHLIDTTMLFAP